MLPIIIMGIDGVMSRSDGLMLERGRDVYSCVGWTDEALVFVIS